MTTLQFLGGAGTVTGSKYLISSQGKNILVDCGMFQGLKSLRLKNWDGFPIEASQVDAILLTHAHIDHSGYIPRFIKNGFRGKIYSTAATKDLCEILLPDAGYLAEEEAAYLNKHKKSKHSPALPLFTMEEGQNALRYFETVPFRERRTLAQGLSFEFYYAGHILGASSVRLEIDGKKIVFTGDIGRSDDPIFFSPEPLPSMDYLVTESTYGNRRHKQNNPREDLKNVILQAIQKNGVIVIPSFAVGRAQTLMYYLWQLRQKNEIPSFPMYLNSPMATDVNSLFIKYHELHRLSAEEAREVCGVVQYVRSQEDSIRLNEQKGPMLIISASGMVSGGRILHHIKKFGPDERNTILLTGFQAAGTRGEALVNGASEIKIHGEYVPIRAQVVKLDNMSAHADFQEIINTFKKEKLTPKAVFITHGEPSAADNLRRLLTENFGWKSIIPEQDQKVELE